MLVYHGSPNTFDTFDLTRSHGMIWLTSNIDYAAEFGQVKTFGLKINNPLDMSDKAQELPLECWQDILTDLGIDTNSIDWDTVDFAPDYGYYYFYDLLPHAGNNYANAGTLDAIKAAGYDSIVAPAEYCAGVCSDITYVIFDQNCLKEA